MVVVVVVLVVVVCMVVGLLVCMLSCLCCCSLPCLEDCVIACFLLPLSCKVVVVHWLVVWGLVSCLVGWLFLVVVAVGFGTVGE